MWKGVLRSYRSWMSLIVRNDKTHDSWWYKDMRNVRGRQGEACW